MGVRVIVPMNYVASRYNDCARVDIKLPPPGPRLLVYLMAQNYRVEGNGGSLPYLVNTSSFDPLGKWDFQAGRG